MKLNELVEYWSFGKTNFGFGATLKLNTTSTWSIKPKQLFQAEKTVFIEFLILDPYEQPVITRTTFTVN